MTSVDSAYGSSTLTQIQHRRAPNFKKMDTNGDGKVDRSEFVATKPKGVTSDQAGALFDKLDSGKTGSLSQSDLSSAFQKLGNATRSSLLQAQASTSASQDSTTQDDTTATQSDSIDGPPPGGPPPGGPPPGGPPPGGPPPAGAKGAKSGSSTTGTSDASTSADSTSTDGTSTDKADTQSFLSQLLAALKSASNSSDSTNDADVPPPPPPPRYSGDKTQSATTGSTGSDTSSSTDTISIGTNSDLLKTLLASFQQASRSYGAGNAYGTRYGTSTQAQSV